MRHGLLAAISCVALSVIGGASVTSAEPTPGRLPIRPQMTCRDFLRFEDEAKPEVVYWFASRGNTGDTVVDVDATDRIVSTVVERCKDAPAAPLSQQVNAEASRFRKRLEAP